MIEFETFEEKIQRLFEKIKFWIPFSSKIA